MIDLGGCADDRSVNNELEKQPVTVLGLGLMGSAIAVALRDAGHPTTVWTR